MPLYEYQCEPCNQSFEILIRGAGDVARCPRCRSIEVIKLLSVPAVAHTSDGRGSTLPVKTEPNGASAFGCGRSQCGSGMCAGLDN